MESDESEAEFLLKVRNKPITNDIEMGSIFTKNLHATPCVKDSAFAKNEIKKDNKAYKEKQKIKIVATLAEENFSHKSETVSEDDDVEKVKENNSETAKLNTELLKCVKHDLFKFAKNLIYSGASPDATCHLRRISVCHMAAYYKSYRILRLILRHGANPFRNDWLGRTPLHFAAWRGSPACLLILLNHTFNSEAQKKKFIEAAEGTPDKLNSRWLDSPHLHNCVGTTFTVSHVRSNQTALQLSLSLLNLRCARHLLEAGARICACKAKAFHVDAQFCPSTMNACGSALQSDDLKVNQRFVEAIKMLIEHGKKPTTLPKRRLCEGYYELIQENRRTALHNTVLIGNGEATKLLLDVGFNSQQLDAFNETPMHCAVVKRKLAPLQYLTEASDVSTNVLHSVLKLAIVNKWISGVILILNALTKLSVNIDKKYQNGNTSLHIAAGTGEPLMVNIIVNTFRANHLSIDTKNYSGYTPLHKAIHAGDASTVRVLLHQGAKFDIELHDGRNVLHEAAKKGDHEILAELIETTKLFEKCAEFISKKDDDGLSPLHWASFANSYKCVKLLFEAGANLYTLGSKGSFYGYTVLHMAAINNSVNVSRMIYTINPSFIYSADFDGLLPFHRAIINGHREISTLFLMKGADMSDKIYLQGKRRSAIEIISKKWRHPKEYLESLLDMHIAKNEFNLDDARCVVTLNYSLFIPCTTKESPKRMKVLEKMFGGELGFDELLLHPLVESFLHLEWKRLRIFFFGIAAVYTLLSFFITCLVIDIYDNNGYSIAWEICAWINLIFIVFMECTLMSESRSFRYLGELECVAKIISLLFALMLLIDCRTSDDLGRELSRALSSLAILTAWSQLGIQFSRLIGEFYFQMFTRVAARVAKVMILFGCFPIIGFALAFWIMFSGHTPFNTWMDSIVKTIVMMTSEFDYSDLFEDKPFDMFWVTTRLLFLAYIASVSIVLINLLMALAISGTRDLEVEGKTQRLLQQVHFLGTLDGFAFNIVWKVLPEFISNHIPKVQISHLTLYPGRTGFWKWENNNISEKFASKIFNYLSKRKSTDQDTKHEVNVNMDVDVERINLLKNEIFNEYAQIFEDHMGALNKKIDYVTQLVKNRRRFSYRQLENSNHRRKRKKTR